MSKTVIFHNPACSTSRNALAMIRDAGIEPEVVEYMKAGWTEPQLKDLFARMGKRPAEVVRKRAEGAEALLAPGVSDAAILEAMVANPVLVERPIVATDKGVRLGRPIDDIKDIL